MPYFQFQGIRKYDPLIHIIRISRISLWIFNNKVLGLRGLGYLIECLVWWQNKFQHHVVYCLKSNLVFMSTFIRFFLEIDSQGRICIRIDWLFENCDISVIKNIIGKYLPYQKRKLSKSVLNVVSFTLLIVGWFYNLWLQNDQRYRKFENFDENLHKSSKISISLCGKRCSHRSSGCYDYTETDRAL